VPSADRASADQDLVRGIGAWALTAFAVNAMIGAGIFGLPARIQGLTGNYSVLVILGCGALIAMIALCFAEVASRFERTGGPQLYTSVAFGQIPGFTVGWLTWISRLASASAVANLMVDYATVLSGSLAGPYPRGFMISTVILAYTWINVRGIRQASAVITSFTIAKLIPLLAFALVGLFFIEPESLQLGTVPSSRDAATAILLATFAFFGFDATAVVAGEARDARRSVPFAIFVSVAGVAALYCLIQLVCVGTLPDLASSERPLADAATLFVGPWGAIAIAVGAVISCIGMIGSTFTTATRTVFAMSDQAQLPALLARVHPRFSTPHVAIVVTGIAALALALSGTFIYLVKLTLISRILVYAATCVSLPVLRGRHDVPGATFRLPAGRVIGYVSAALCVLFLAKSSMRELLDVAIAVVIGLAILGLTRSAQRRAVAPTT
jgi:amino acid transporter